MRRALPLVAVALLAGGCGGSSTSLSDAARLAPADASVFVAVRTTDDHWRTFVRQLLGRVPTVPRDAHEVAFAVVDGRIRTLTREPAHSLADTGAYRAALETVPNGANAIAYTSGTDARRRLLAFPGQIVVTNNPVRVRTIPRPRPGPSQLAELRYRWGVAWQTSDGAGARVKSAGLPVAKTRFARGVQQLVTMYAPTLLDEIPADALAALDFPLGQGSFESLDELPAIVTRIFHGTRFDLPLELDGLLQGETAIYFRRGGEITVVTSPHDVRVAEHALKELLAARNPPFDLRRVYHASIGGQFVFSTSARGIAAFRGAGDKLSSKLETPEMVSALLYASPEAPHLLRRLGLELAPSLSWVAADGDDVTVTTRFTR